MAERIKFKSPVIKLRGMPRFGKKHRSAGGPITAIDVEGGLLRVAQTTSRTTRIAVTRIGAEKIELAADADRTDPTVMGKAIGKALDKMRIRPGSAVMGVPRAQVVLRTLVVPVVDDVRELASIVLLQVGKDLPFPAEEAVIDFRVNRRLASAPADQTAKAAEGGSEPRQEPPPDTPHLEVLVAAVKRELVEFYTKAAEVAGFKLAALGWLSAGNARMLEACGLAPGEEAVALVSLRPDEMGIEVVAQQALLFSRGAMIKLHPPEPAAPESEAPNPAATPAEAPAAPSEAASQAPPPTYVDAVVLEAVRSLHSYGGMEPAYPVAKVAVAGATGHEAEVAEALQKRLNLDVVILNPAATIDLPKAGRELAAGSISAMGLGLGMQDREGLPFDFLNPKKPAPQRNLKRIRIIMGIAAAFSVLLFGIGIQQKLKSKRQMMFNTLKAEFDTEVKKRPVYRQMRVQATELNGWSKNGTRWLDHYAYLSAMMPPSEEIYITSFSVGAQGNIRLAVQARSSATLAKLDKQLREAGYDVKPLAVTPGADKHGYDFRSNVELIVPAGMKIDLTKLKAPPRPEDDVSLEPVRGRKGGAS